MHYLHIHVLDMIYYPMRVFLLYLGIISIYDNDFSINYIEGDCVWECGNECLKKSR